MSGEKDLRTLVKFMNPRLNDGEYVFVVADDSQTIERSKTLFEFKEMEGRTIVLLKDIADQLGLSYNYVMSWITLHVHSSLEAVGLTAVFSSALAEHHLSCNVISGYYHDHIFIPKEDAEKALKVLKHLSDTYE
ncbi:ACT domain-containing protein [Aestuariivivens sediminicola]|uniref:ACT domain-containing protein n=1 Tax=Aestuariivivens sediminicola TaxID=2913560 RepID=UPI001F5915C8|nr:ACT domain-containing protein [Aestuariivivens sediminicola]